MSSSSKSQNVLFVKVMNSKIVVRTTEWWRYQQMPVVACNPGSTLT